jgi:hypothetical protein
MPQRKFFMATAILVFDFELFIGGRRQKRKGWLKLYDLMFNMTN